MGKNPYLNSPFNVFVHTTFLSNDMIHKVCTFIFMVLIKHVNDIASLGNYEDTM